MERIRRRRGRTLRGLDEFILGVDDFVPYKSLVCWQPLPKAWPGLRVATQFNFDNFFLEFAKLNADRIEMNAGDMVYYLYTDKNGTPIKCAAIVCSLESDGILIRVGRYDVHTREVKTFEAVVAATALRPRSVPCSYETELTGPA